MTVATQSIHRAPRPSSLADVLEVVLDKGIVIDAYVRVAVVGIELLTIDARIVIASVDTYLRFAEAVNRLELESNRDQASGLPGLVGELQEGGAKSKTRGALTGAKETAKGAFDSLTPDDDDDQEEEEERRPRRRTTKKVPAKKSSSSTRRRRQGD